MRHKLWHDHAYKGLSDLIYYYDEEKYQSSLNVIDNIIFGKLNIIKRNALDIIKPYIISIIQQEGFYDDVFYLGFMSSVGSNGAKLSSTMRIKVVLTRLLLRDTPYLVINGLINSLNTHQKKEIIEALVDLRKDKNLLLVLQDEELLTYFEHVLRFKQAKIMHERRKVKK